MAAALVNGYMFGLPQQPPARGQASTALPFEEASVQSKAVEGYSKPVQSKAVERYSKSVQSKAVAGY